MLGSSLSLAINHSPSHRARRHGLGVRSDKLSTRKDEARGRHRAQRAEEMLIGDVRVSPVKTVLPAGNVRVFFSVSRRRGEAFARAAEFVIGAPRACNARHICDILPAAPLSPPLRGKASSAATCYY